MAEVVGLVVGLASFGAQLLEGTRKLKGLCDSIKDAPIELQDTIEGIEVMSEIISLMASADSQRLSEGTVLGRSLELCRKALNRLVNLTHDLQQRIQNTGRFNGAIHVTFKKESMERLIARLEQCKGLLQLSHQLYMGAQNMSRFDSQERALRELHAGQMTLVANCLSRPDSRKQLVAGDERASSSSEEMGRHRTTHSANGSVLAIRIRIPGWTTSRVLELSVAQVIAGWTASLRCYRILADDDPVFVACEENDLTALRRLFEDRKAGIYDRDQWGCSVFEVAMMFGAVDICKFLYTQGGGTLAEHNQEMVIYFFWESYLTTTPFITTGSNRSLSVVNKIRNRCACDLMQLGFNGSDEIFQEARLKALWNPTSLSASDQIDSMLGIVDMIYYSSGTTMASVLQDMLGDGPLDTSLLDPTAADGKSPMHIFAVAHACLLYYSNFNAVADLESFSYTASRITECIAATPGHLHSRGIWVHHWYDDMTPLAIFINSVMAPSGSHVDDALLDRALQSWAHLLACAGTDLAAYGEREAAMNCEYFNSWAPKSEIIGLSWGVNPADWHFWFMEYSDHFAGIFWDLVEEPERRVPGAWIDEDDRTGR